MKHALLAALLIPILFAGARAGGIKPPKLTPVPSTEAQKARIKEGVALHDKRDYDGAIRAYLAVLAENPANADALYELGYSYLEKKDYEKSLETGLKGAEYKSDLLGGFYMLIGNSLDELGRSQQAVDAYKAGIKQLPGLAMLHFNLGLTYARMGKAAEARSSLKTSLALNPRHASSHYALGTLLFDEGYQTPALFAALRFLVLEPRSPRSEAALKIANEALRGGVTEGDGPDSVKITLTMGGKTDEGDFGPVDLILGLSKAVGNAEKNKDKTEAQLLVEQMDTVLAVLSESDPGKNKSKFVYKYYVPYFVELKKRNFTEPFVYHAFQGSSLPGAEAWLTANEARVREFLAWSEQFPWARDAAK
jgi:tetratricopeptide (TPR) repeat protein